MKIELSERLQTTGMRVSEKEAAVEYPSQVLKKKWLIFFVFPNHSKSLA